MTNMRHEDTTTHWFICSEFQLWSLELDVCLAFPSFALQVSKPNVRLTKYQLLVWFANSRWREVDRPCWPLYEDSRQAALICENAFNKGSWPWCLCHMRIITTRSDWFGDILGKTISFQKIQNRWKVLFLTAESRPLLSPLLSPSLSRIWISGSIFLCWWWGLLTHPLLQICLSS